MPVAVQGAGKGGIPFLQAREARSQQGKGRQVGEDDSPFRRNQFIVNAVFDKETRSQKQDESADPGKQLGSYEIFPGKGGGNGCRLSGLPGCGNGGLIGDDGRGGRCGDDTGRGVEAPGLAAFWGVLLVTDLP